MQFNYLKEDKINEITVKILIVEDTKSQAFAIKNSIKSYTSKLNGIKDIFSNEIKVNYTVIINGNTDFTEENFRGNEDYLKSVKYCYDNPSGIDIILCDYELSNSKGNIFLEEVAQLEITEGKRYYKILHSVSNETQKYQLSANHIDAIFDSKTHDTIVNNILIPFEENILIPILFGNPTEHSNIYNSTQHTRYLAKLSSEYFYDEYSYSKILAVYSSNQRKYFQPIVINENYSISKGKLSTNPIKDLLSTNFTSFGQSLSVNKLWLSKHDVLKNNFHFIRPGTDLYTFDVQTYISPSSNKFSYVLTMLFNMIKAKEKPPLFNFDKLNRYFTS